MKAESVTTIKKELNQLSTTQLVQLCLRLARFKKENKELLTYLLFESHNESGYIESVKAHIDEELERINTNSYFYIRKSMRKILKRVKTFIRYSQKKETEVELLLYFCKQIKTFKPSISKSTQLKNMYLTQLALAKKGISNLHEDLQYDYNLIIEELDTI